MRDFSGVEKGSFQKLAKVAKLITGMPINEAILQTNFSLKKQAREQVLPVLTRMKDEAIHRKMSIDDVIVCKLV